MENLKDFMLLFRMELKTNAQPSAEALANMKKAWGSWIGSIAQQAKLVSSHQLGFEGKLLRKNTETVSTYWVNENGMSVSGNMVVKATSLEEASTIAKGCPILEMGGVVEVRNTLNVF